VRLRNRHAEAIPPSPRTRTLAPRTRTLAPRRLERLGFTRNPEPARSPAPRALLKRLERDAEVARIGHVDRQLLGSGFRAARRQEIHGIDDVGPRDLRELLPGGGVRKGPSTHGHSLPVTGQSRELSSGVASTFLKLRRNGSRDLALRPSRGWGRSDVYLVRYAVDRETDAPERTKYRVLRRDGWESRSTSQMPFSGASRHCV